MRYTRFALIAVLYFLLVPRRAWRPRSDGPLPAPTVVS